MAAILSQSQIMRHWGPPCNGRFATVRLHGAGEVTVRAAAVDAVKALDKCLVKWNYRTRAADTGAGVCRLKVSGDGWSVHALWIALDINWQSNPYGSRLRTNMPLGMPRDICAIRTRSGHQVWNWGGYWRGSKDAMHYEIVCTPAQLATGIDPRTVPGGGKMPTPLPPKSATPPPPVPEEDDEMKSQVVLHHNGEHWVHWGDGTRTRLPNGPGKTSADHLAFREARARDWALLFGGPDRYVKLNENKGPNHRISQTMLEDTTDKAVLGHLVGIAMAAVFVVNSTKAIAAKVGTKLRGDGSREA